MAALASSSDSEVSDISSNWSAKDSIDQEIKQMRRQKRLEQKVGKPPKLMIENELKKGEL